MEIGKPVKEIEIPQAVPAQQPTQAPAEPEMLPLPADWPVRAPVRPVAVPETARP